MRPLDKSPGTKAVESLQSYLEAKLFFAWDHRTDAHSPHLGLSEIEAISPESFEYQANPKGAIFFEKRSRSTPFPSATPFNYGETILGFRVLCSHSDRTVVAQELRDIDWLLEKTASKMLEGGDGVPRLALSYQGTTFTEVIQSHESAAGGVDGYTTGGFLARYVLRAPR